MNETPTIRYVTITGADNATSELALSELSAEFPWVEWGILVSRRQEGSFRFPDRNWIARFLAAIGPRVNVSMHLCGQWVRRTLMGENVWAELPEGIAARAQRVQINTHAETLASTASMVNRLSELGDKEFIFQWDGVNDHLAHAVAGYGLKAAALFDTSGGAGILPSKWPTPDLRLPCGYAGGLGPDNVSAQLRAIAAICGPPSSVASLCTRAGVFEGSKAFWIDMERRVRTEDDSLLDLSKVRKVLRNVRLMIERGEVTVASGEVQA